MQMHFTRAREEGRNHGMIAKSIAPPSWFAVGCSILFVSASLTAKPLDYPSNNAEFYLQVSEDYQTKINEDGSVIAIGPKAVIALTSMKGISSKKAAKSALPAQAKAFFVNNLHFQDVTVQGVDDDKIVRDDGSDFPVSVLKASGKNSDGNEIAVTATAFASEQGHYFIFLTAAKPEDKEEVNKTRREILATMMTAINEED
jgi:hypothetical protein